MKYKTEKFEMIVNAYMMLNLCVSGEAVVDMATWVAHACVRVSYAQHDLHNHMVVIFSANIIHKRSD